jgi:tetratricopeptide (TPR) repeat protein
VARTSCFYFKGKQFDIREAAGKLGVSTVLEGSLRRSGSSVRVTAQLIRAQDGCHIASQQFDRNLTDLLEIQAEIAGSIVRVLRGKVADERQIRLMSRFSRDPETWRLCMQGRYYLNHMLPGGQLTAARCYEQCLEREPGMAPALAGLADCYIDLGLLGLMPSREAKVRAQQAARRALEIDGRLAEAHKSLGVLLAAAYQWEAGEREFLTALSIDPDNAMAHMFYAGGILASLGRLQEAHLHQEEAYRADPVNPSVAVGFAADLVFLRQYTRAIEACRKALELDPGFPMAFRWMGEALLLLGRYDEAVATLAAVPIPPLVAGLQGFGLARLGRMEEVEALVRQLETLPPGMPQPAHQVAILQLGLGNTDAVFANLARACDEGSFGVTWLRIDPIWDPIRADARFDRLLERMNLPAGAGGSFWGRAAGTSPQRQVRS